jgi:hypothetical protein
MGEPGVAFLVIFAPERRGSGKLEFTEIYFVQNSRVRALGCRRGVLWHAVARWGVVSETYVRHCNCFETSNFLGFTDVDF